MAISNDVFCSELDGYLKKTKTPVAQRKKIIAYEFEHSKDRDETLEIYRRDAELFLSLAKDCKSVESEKSAQQRVVEWFRKTYPEDDIYMNRNDGFRQASEKAEQITLGLLKGVPDLMIPDAFCYVEMKKEKGGVISQWQKDFADKRVKAGYKVLFCYGYDDAVLKISAVMKSYNTLKFLNN